MGKVSSFIKKGFLKTKKVLARALANSALFMFGACALVAVGLNVVSFDKGQEVLDSVDKDARFVAMVKAEYEDFENSSLASGKLLTTQDKDDKINELKSSEKKMEFVQDYGTQEQYKLLGQQRALSIAGVSASVLMVPIGAAGTLLAAKEEDELEQ